MLVQVKNRIFLLEAVSYAFILFPSDDRAVKPVELHLVVDGCPINLAGEEALIVWTAISKNAISLELDQCSDSAARSSRSI